MESSVTFLRVSQNLLEATLHRIHLTPTSKRRRLAETWDFVSRVENMSDAVAVKSALLETAGAFGLSSLFAGWIPSLTRSLDAPDIAACILHDHGPGEWAERYIEKGYVRQDPIVVRLQSDHAPFTWQQAYSVSPSQDDAELIAREASAFGLRTGFVVPVHLVGGLSLAFSFGGPALDADPDGLSHLAFATNFAAGHLHALMKDSSDSSFNKLTRREIDCLSWAAEGKCDWAVATILGISRPTVIKHLASVREKLGASSKSHAIAIALRTKILR